MGAFSADTLTITPEALTLIARIDKFEGSVPVVAVLAQKVPSGVTSKGRRRTAFARHPGCQAGGVGV